MVEVLISKYLRKIADDIELGNCRISEPEASVVIDYLKEVSSPLMSKYQACDYVGVSRATFDMMVAAGILPKGEKKVGFKELFWNKNNIDKALKDVTKCN